ncbi:aspartate/glutamate racemase family protein [Variovorax ureilyticus]|uniref:Aspartate/glutamate racemase family protein n=1 Tax=Variovorax ureilyticus TaxID=1836198 RepID=A0ABU8VLX6_9BURK
MPPFTEPGFLGVLMLDTKFPRPPGDIGNPETFKRAGIPVRYSVVRGASPQRIVRDADVGFLRPFIDAATELANQGAAMLTTSCGFLAAYQDALADAVPVPVITSSILQCRDHAAPGIVTFDAASMSSSILAAARVPAETPVQGIEPGSEFHTRILGNQSQLDLKQAEADVVNAAKALTAAHPEVDTIVLECTNMPPYRRAVAAATGRNVVDIETLLIARWNAEFGSR